MGAVDSAVKTAMQSTTTEIERLNGELTKLRADHEECHRKNRKLQAELDELKNSIDKLMEGGVPGYELGPAGKTR